MSPAKRSCIPERIVHARCSGAHGVFECYQSLCKFTSASLFAESGKRTPVSARFCTALGECGAADTVRALRGFAVKFQTDAGTWDLVGHNIPVFFIPDAMDSPEFVHAVRPEPGFTSPHAATAHDRFWDFVSRRPESTHMLMWLMSDRAIPRSYRMMQGFGVHTFRFVNAAGESNYVKFHWQPLAGVYALDWDEAMKLAGAAPDYHRRDLWESIDAGALPAFELGVQLFTEEQAARWSFDIFDDTKLIPEELIPIVPIGHMTLERNPDCSFFQSEQADFCVSHLVPGIDLAEDEKLRERDLETHFMDPYAQATLFWNSQSRPEKNHILRAFRFELTKVRMPAVRERVVELLSFVSAELAQPLAQALGLSLPPEQPDAVRSVPEITQSCALSLLTHPGDGTIRGRRVAILMADGVNGDSVQTLYSGLLGQGAVPRLVGSQLGAVKSESGESIPIDATLETTPAVLYDALIVPDGEAAAVMLGTLGQALEFIRDQYRHCKPILALGAGTDVVEFAGVPATLSDGSDDIALIRRPLSAAPEALSLFIEAIAAYRNYARETDPPSL